MAGIERVHILQGFENNDDRDKKSLKMEPTANKTYFKMFNDLGMPLLEGIDIIECETVKDAMAKYDYIDGIDCILNLQNKHRITIQEKFLFTDFKTVTFTETDKWGRTGSFYSCIAQYYFVGYAMNYPIDLRFRDYMLIDFPGLLRYDANNKLNWHFNNNNYNPLNKIKFRFLYYKDIPNSVIIYYHNNNLENKQEYPTHARKLGI